jgi:hypothetical protein
MPVFGSTVSVIPSACPASWINEAGAAGKVPSRRVLRRLEQIERLPRRKQIALLTTIDAFLQSAESATAS